MKSKETLGLSRRGFLKWSAAAAALPVGLTGCSKSDTIEAGGNGGGSVLADDPQALLAGGKWVPFSCPGCSRFWCINQVYVVDGVPIRQKTQDDHEFTLAYPQYRSCAKARGMRWSVLSPSRMKYPMKRKNWKPGGGVANSTPHLRGKDEWEIISWDEAIKTISSEFKRVCQTYGSVYNGVRGVGYTPTSNYGKDIPVLNLCYTADREPRFLNYLGYGSMPMYGQNSPGGWPVVENKILTSGISTDWRNLAEKTKVIVQWGRNPVWSRYGAEQLAFLAAKKRGAKVYCVDPWFNPGNNAWTDEWIPVRPGTDTALLLAIAYVLIDEGMVKTDFLFKHTLGYDADHMPMYDKLGNELQERNYDPATKTSTFTSIVENDPTRPGRKRNKYYELNFKDYVLGTYDHKPKNPEWATQICGTPVDKIYELARAMGNVENPLEELAFMANSSTGRHYHGATMAQTFITLSWLLGGPIGGSFGGGSYSGFMHGYNPVTGTYFNNDPARTIYPRTMNMPWYGLLGPYANENPKAAPAYGAIIAPIITIEDNYKDDRLYGVAFAEVPRAIKEGKFHNFVHGEENCDIRAIIKLHNGDQTNQNVNTKAYIQDGHRNEKIEIIVASDFTMSTDLRYADIILPSTTMWESDGFFGALNPEAFVLNPHRVVEPLFQAKPDFDVDELLCKAVGATDAEAKGFAQPMGLTVHENVVNALAEATVMRPNGSGYEPLIKFDDDDLDEIGAAASLSTNPALGTGRIPYKEFKKKGYYQVRVNEAMRQQMNSTLAAFLGETPAPDGLLPDWMKKTNNLGTETGFYEIFSINLYNYYQNFWYDAEKVSLDASVDESEGVAKRSQLLYPIAKYRAQPDGYEDTLSTEFNLQYYGVHPHHRVHSLRVDNPNILEVFDDILFIHPDTARNNGDLKHGDTVILTSSNGGKIMRRVSVTNTVIPGVLVGTEGSKARYLDDEATPEVTDWANTIDYSGNTNTLTASHLVGQAHQAYNTIIVKMEKAPGGLVPQYKWEPDVPEAKRTVVSNFFKQGR